jgi:cytochrome c-type biogenesis protein CcmF
LIVLTFALSIFGAFLTRSGIISSVHAFGQSRVGYVFLFFLINILVISFYFVAIRYQALKERNPKIESLVSRESSFLYNNILLVGLCFATFWGTVFPLISEAVKGVKISVGPPFFNTVNSPLFLLLVGLMAMCPMLGWRSTSWRSVAKNLLLPSLLMLLSLPVLYFFGVNEFLPLFFYGLSLFVLVTLVLEYYQGANVAVRNDNEGRAMSLFSFALKNRRRYGGFLVHAGIVFMAVGLVGYGFFQFKEDFRMKPGEEIMIQDYRLKYKGLRAISGSNYKGGGAIIEVYRGDQFLKILQPEKRSYQKDKPSTTEVAIMNNLKEDLYLILGSWERNSTISLTVVINPLLMWVWVGTGVVILGVLWAVLPVKKKDLELNSLTMDYLVSLRGTK